VIGTQIHVLREDRRLALRRAAGNQAALIERLRGRAETLRAEPPFFVHELKRERFSMRTAAAFRDSLDLLEQLGRGAPRRIYEVIFREQGRDENVRMDAEASGQAGAPAPANFGDRLAQRFAMRAPALSR